MLFRWRSIILIVLAPLWAHAAKRPGGGAVNLPYTTPDGKSPCWIVQQGGWVQQRRLNDEAIYGQVAMLNIEENTANQTNNQARVDPKTGEVTLDAFQPMDGVQLTRRIQARRDDDLLRYIDIFKNTTSTDISVGVQYTTSLNRGVIMGQTISDLKKSGADLAWVAQTQRGRTAVEIFAGKGAQTAGQVQWEQGNNAMQYNVQVEVPAGKSVALMHLHVIAASPDKGAEIVNTLKSSRIISDLPADVRKMIVNFPVNQNFVGDREILRGGMFDVVELRGGDSLFGTLQEKSYALQTSFGAFELPSEKIVGLISVGQFRARQLLVSSEGEMIGGTMSKQTIDLQLTSGQTTQIPLSQISRVGYRKRVDEPDDWKLDKPMVVLQSGDRMNIDLPEQPMEVLTRFGAFKLAPAAIASISLQGEEHGVHQFVLASGSRFAGLLSAEQLTVKLTSTQKTITLPTSSIARLQFQPEGVGATSPGAAVPAAAVPAAEATRASQPRKDSPTLTLTSGDVFAGELVGDLNLVTLFDQIKLPAAQIRGLTRVKETNDDVQVTLWDQTKLSGQLDVPSLTCDLGGGVTVKVPVPLIDSYLQPSPMPSEQMLKQISAIVQQLNAEDFKARDLAQQELVTMGAVVLPVLKKIRADQAPEAQQRIDAIVKQFEKPPAVMNPGASEPSKDVP